MADHWSIRIENSDAMVVDLEMEEFAESDAEGDAEDAPRRMIPLRDYFWVGIALAFLQFLYLLSKFEYFQKWWD